MISNLIRTIVRCYVGLLMAVVGWQLAAMGRCVRMARYAAGYPLLVVRRSWRNYFQQKTSNENCMDIPSKSSMSTASGAGRMRMLVRHDLPGGDSGGADGVGWRPDWRLLDKAPASQHGQQLRSMLRELSLDLPVITVRQPNVRAIIHSFGLI